MSKGSWRRPADVSNKFFEESWDRIFGDSKAKVQQRKQVPVSGVPYPVEEDKLCCNGDCNQGRDCPMRKDK